MSIQINHNYRIGTDTLTSGKVKATARGRKTNVRTFPAGTSHEDAARTLALKIEGERFESVKIVSGSIEWKADWAVFVRVGS